MLKRILMVFLVYLLCITVSGGGPAAAADVKIRFTDKTHLTYEGDWAIISYQAYTSKTVGSGKRMGTMTCRPGLSGVYEIIAEYKATENRGKRALYYVNGRLAREVDQHIASGMAFPKVSIGVFNLTPDSTVELRAQDGRSYSFVSFRFVPSDGTPAGPGDPTPPPVSTGPDPGSGSGDELLATGSGKMTIEPYLSTYHPARLAVILDGKEIFVWERANDRDGSPAVFQGKKDPASMMERTPGDYSPVRGLKYTCEVKSGQKVKIIRSGNYNQGTFLKVKGPFGGGGQTMDDVLNLK